ncbi:uncharacterized protein LOC126895119 isoform X2 [Daktulosphaira vitifoliae]|uniref:uncharacterized protein LOC126895119 isoform X2 n=1 Tax=Daktulosphaira vitifoliae TaxID=58002 RepID=UPI0021AA04EF|nr:uncharacterized protein LOC126895119 isoform X2 [Daktulosphaira vitifoliae]
MYKRSRKNECLNYNSFFFEELCLFPKITHANWSISHNNSIIKMILKDPVLHDNIIRSSDLLCNTLSSNSKCLTLQPYTKSNNISSILSSLKKIVPDFPVSDTYKKLKKQCVLAMKNSIEGENLWINKYKPISNTEVLSNSVLVKKLKKWLESYKKSEHNKNIKYKYYDHDFIDNNDSNNTHKVPHNIAILVGPIGCGKTAAVYAVASELDANIIELNASCNRNGKRILTDLIEATQSHAVKKNPIFNMVKEKKKNIKNVKKQECKKEKMTIILIEDADIIFENYDDGFISALSTLGTDSKRPLILVINDPFSNHLLKFFNSNELILFFEYPTRDYLKCLLHLIALNEGAVVTDKITDSLIHIYKPDIRQSIIQLEYMVKSGELKQDILKSAVTHNLSINSTWWNWPTTTGCYKINSSKNKKTDLAENISSLSQYLDELSKLNLIFTKTQNYTFLDPQPFWNEITIRDSSTQNMNNYSHSNLNLLSTELSQWIYEKLNIQEDINEIYIATSEILCERQKLWDTSRDILNQIGLENCNRKYQTSFDYLATIRSMGRINQGNQPSGNLRQSRAFPYLKRINIDVDDDKLKQLCDSLCINNKDNKSNEVLDQF